MKSRDIIDLYKRVGVGAEVKVVRGSLFRTPQIQPNQGYAAQGVRPARASQPNQTQPVERKLRRAGPSI